MEYTINLEIFYPHADAAGMMLHIGHLKLSNDDLILILFLVFNATFSNISAISWRPVLVVEEAGVPGPPLY